MLPLNVVRTPAVRAGKSTTKGNAIVGALASVATALSVLGGDDQGSPIRLLDDCGVLIKIISEVFYVH